MPTNPQELCECETSNQYTASVFFFFFAVVSFRGKQTSLKGLCARFPRIYCDSLAGFLRERRRTTITSLLLSSRGIKLVDIMCELPHHQ